MATCQYKWVLFYLFFYFLPEKSKWMPVPVTEGGEAHGGWHKCHSPEERGVAT